MIKSFKNRSLKRFFLKGQAQNIDATLRGRVALLLDQLDASEMPGDMNTPGNDFHPLSNLTPARYSVHVNGNWCITFEWDGEDAVRIDLEDYH